MVVLRTPRAHLLGREHRARHALERDDARDREGPEAAFPELGHGVGCARLESGSPSSGPATSASSPAACFADLGHDVAVRDVDERKIAELQAVACPSTSPVSRSCSTGTRSACVHARRRGGDRGRRVRVRGRRHAAHVLGRRGPLGGVDGVDELPEVERRLVVVMKSTVPVGTGREVRARLDDRGLGTSATCRTRSSPPRGPPSATSCTRTASSSARSTTPTATWSRSCTRGIDAPIVRSDVASAEMIKLAANAALMTRISFINEIANVCEATGADVVRVAEGVGLDRRIGPSFLRAGLGYGGSCFPKDSLALKQLAANSGYHFQLLNAVIEVNELQKRRVIGKLQRHLGTLRGRKVALPRARVQARHRRHARGAVARARRPPARGGSGRVAPGTRSRGSTACCTASSSSRRSTRPLERRRRGRLVTEWPELAEVDWRGGRRPHAQRARNRRPQHARSRLDARPPVSSTRASTPRCSARQLNTVENRGDAGEPADRPHPEADASRAGRPAVASHIRVYLRPHDATSGSRAACADPDVKIKFGGDRPGSSNAQARAV